MESHLTKIYLLFGFILSYSITIAQTPCEANMAGGFPCEGYDLQDRLTNSDMDANFTNDSWGWVDPQDGKEYALIGLENGTAFIDISDPNNVIYLGKLPTQTSNSAWRDIKVYQNHAFVVSEANGHGMQVFDLTQLRNVTNPPVTFTETAHYDQFGNAHNIVINEETGFAYAVGTSTFSGGPHFIDITTPSNPSPAGGHSISGYTHDAQVVLYTGPDTDYQGREILIGSNLSLVAIVDVTDKNNPIEIATMTYSGIDIAHQGWFTEDQRFFLLGDEGDEVNSGFSTRTIVFDLEDLDNPEIHFEYEGTNPSTDHNGYVVGNLFYLASYRAGMRVIDISDIANQNIFETGYFDTTPSSNNVGASGLWNVYPFFESGNIVLSGSDGFTLVKQNEILDVTNFEILNEMDIFPNPSTGVITLKTNAPIGLIEVYNTLGQIVYETSSTSTDTELNLTHLQTGLYFVKTTKSTQKLILK